MRIDAKNDDGRQSLPRSRKRTATRRSSPGCCGLVRTTTKLRWLWRGSPAGMENGGMSMEIMQVEGSTAYALLTNIGGEFEPGDRILFDMSHHDQNVDLFEIPVPEQLEQELVIELDGESGRMTASAGRRRRSRRSLSSSMGYMAAARRATRRSPSHSRTGPALRFPARKTATRTARMEPTVHGAAPTPAAGRSNEVKNTWLFSQIIDLDELASVTVCGVTYPVYNKNNAKRHNRNTHITNKHFQSAAGYAKLRKNTAGGI